MFYILTVRSAPVAGEGFGEFAADRFAVRREDDEAPRTGRRALGRVLAQQHG